MNIRKARMEDVSNIRELINIFALKEAMLPRSLNMLYESLRDFWVGEENSQIIACCALHPIWQDMAEIKSLAVREDIQKKGLGAEMVKACLSESEVLGIKKVFALTYVPDFFCRLGFKRGEKENMPHKIWSECIKCPHFPDCNEILVEMEL